jgi:recombination protein RecR
MADIAEPVNRLVEQFKKLPGIGTKSAQRLAFFILKMDMLDATQLAETILEVKRSIRRCSTCNNLTDIDPCRFCTHPGRSDKVLCIVEESNNILPVEKTREFNGRYHVLMGSISPLKGVSPEQLGIPSLLLRLQSGLIEEVIVATNPNVEGETTAMYLSRLIKPLGIRVTRLALGLPMGGDLEYADEVTMSKALEGRREL